MGATLDVRFIGPNEAIYNAPAPPFSRFATFTAGNFLRSNISAAFDQWVNRFDYTTGNYTINVNVGSSAAAEADPSGVRLSGDTYVQIGTSGGIAITEPLFGLNVVGRNGPVPAAPALTLNSPGPTSFAQSALVREFEHALGARSARGTSAVPGPAGGRTLYDGSVVDTTLAQGQAPQLAFAGSDTQAFFGGPVPLSPLDGSTVSLGATIPYGSANEYSSSDQPAFAVQALDVVMLRDAGLPALTDQEILEHQIARLYFGALGRVATGAELTASARYYLDALPPTLNARPGLGAAAGQQVLGGIGSALVSGSEFASRYGALSNADYVRTVYQNTFGRAVDAQTLSAMAQYLTSYGTVGRGAVLFTLTDLLEARGRLSANANVTYSGTVEAQAARLYDTAFGRAADSGGYAQYTRALINGFTLKQAAVSFLQSGEFTTRYGASPSDQALVDGLYQNTLGRAPDAAGEAQYMRALASGLFDHADLVVAFSESSEHIGLMAQHAGARDAAGLFLNTQTPLGLIPVLSGTAPYPAGASSG